jgi:4-aminobutyrate aminotransferase-like enzyme
VFAFPAAYDPSVLQFKPPLILTEEEADTIVALVRDTLG